MRSSLSDAALLELEQVVYDKLRRAKKASRQLSLLSAQEKNSALLQIGNALWRSRGTILAANAQDVRAARERGQSETRIDRLLLTETRIAEMMTSLEQVAALPDPVGAVLETISRPNGLVMEKVRVPMGVIAMVYESRPNVTVDAAALALKTGNVSVLRGGSEALLSNTELVGAIQEGLTAAGVTPEAVQFIHRVEHESVDILIRAKGLVDLAIPRGGEGLISHVVNRALVPVIETGTGNCHVYVDAAADLAKAQNIVFNAKVQRPSVCNAAETVLVHEDIAPSVLPQMAANLVDAGIELRVCSRTWTLLEGAGGVTEFPNVKHATEADWATEFHAPILAVKVVNSVDEAIDHVAEYGTKHSESIITEDADAAAKFLAAVDAAAVYHNASTRFTDGFEFGFGAEMGISTQKLHARGPMGLPELTSYKYVIHGNGQVRT